MSAITATVLFLNLDKLIAIPTPAELKEAREKAAEEEVKRMRIEVESRANSIFQFSIELFPTGVLVIDKDQNIQITNKLLEETFGYTKSELIHKDISVLLQAKHLENHKALVSDYMKNPYGERQMASGRLVWGLKKSGESIPVEVTLSVHEFENEMLCKSARNLECDYLQGFHLGYPAIPSGNWETFLSESAKRPSV